VKKPVLQHGASSIEKAIQMAFSHILIGLHRQPHRTTSPVEVRFAPAGKRFDIIGAVDEVSPFPVANSPETTPCEVADEIIGLRPIWPALAMLNE
jgi:hypothetical protein